MEFAAVLKSWMIENRLVPCRRCGPREIFEAPDYPEFHLVLYLIVNLKNEYEMNSIVNQFMLIKKIGWGEERVIQIYWIYSSRSRSKLTIHSNPHPRRELKLRRCSAGPHPSTPYHLHSLGRGVVQLRNGPYLVSRKEVLKNKSSAPALFFIHHSC